MIVLSNSTTQIIPAGGTVTFDVTPLHTGCNSEGYGGAEYHKQGTGLVRLRASTKCRPSVFEIIFSGNVSNPAAGTQLNIAIDLDGVTLPETNMLETVLVAGLFENVSTATAVKVCPDNGGSVTVVNKGTDPVTLAPGSSLYIKRIAQEMITEFEYGKAISDIKNKLIRQMSQTKYHDSDKTHDTHEAMPNRELSTMGQMKSMRSSADLTKLVGDMMCNRR